MFIIHHWWWLSGPLARISLWTILVVIPLSVAFDYGMARHATYLANLATTIYLHRCLTHRSLIMRYFLALIFRFLIWFLTGMRPREWVAVHRMHHLYEDKEMDPHSPLWLGLAMVEDHDDALYTTARKEPGMVEKYAPDLANPGLLDRVLFDRRTLGPTLCVILFIALGILFGGILNAIPAAAATFVHFRLYVKIGGKVNGPCHNGGYVRFTNPGNYARNVAEVARISCGEGWHNNHHGLPKSAKLCWSPEEERYDKGWKWIKRFKAVHLLTFPERHPDYNAEHPILGGVPWGSREQYITDHGEGSLPELKELVNA